MVVMHPRNIYIKGSLISFKKSVVKRRHTRLMGMILVDMISLFRKKRFTLNEMFQQNASKFAIFYV